MIFAVPDFRFFSRLVALAITLAPPSPMAQTNTNLVAQWLAHAPPIPEFKSPSSLKSWEKQRKEIRATLWELLGQLAPRPTVPKVTTLSREDRGDYLVEKFEFDNDAGTTVPGYLFLPKNASTRNKRPAILYCHYHGGEYDNGKEEVLKSWPTAEPPGPGLARRGFVVIAIDAYCFGERSGKGPGGPAEKGSREELTTAKFNLWVGWTLWGMILRDDLMALDYLASRKEVDAARIGVTGFSMGATRTWWLLALDERLKTGVAVACLTRYQDLIETVALAAHGIYYFVPRMLNYFDTEAVIALHAPRPVLFMTGDADRGSPASGVRTIEAKVKPVYRLYGAEKNFENTLYPELGHKYLPEMWERTLAWFDQHLASGGGR